MDGSPPSEGRGVTPATTSVRLENIRSGKEARHKYCMTHSHEAFTAVKFRVTK